MDADHYSQLLAFTWAVDTGTFSAAARAHNLTPSAVSKLVTKLEQRMRVRLFIRGTRQLTLTEEGIAYAHVAAKVQDALKEAESVGETLPTEVAGTLVVHTMAAFAKHQIAGWLPEFLSRYPALSVDLKTGPQYVDLFDQGVDIAIHSGTLPSSSRVARKIGQARWICCASDKYLADAPKLDIPEDLAHHQCFMFDFESPWNAWSFLRDGEIVTVPLKSRATFAQGDMLRDMALSGAGIVRLADFHIGDDLASGALRPVLTEFDTQLVEPLYVIYATRKHLSPRIKVFRDFLEERFVGGQAT